MYDPYDPISPKTLIPRYHEEPKKSGWMPWLLGCGCGCLMVLAFALFVLGILYHQRLGF